MPSNNLVKFLVNQDQLTRLESDASKNGFKTLSQYIRSELFRNKEYQINVMGSLHRIESTLNEVIQNGRTKQP